MKVSVVIACYNYGAFLETSVESVLAQTHREVELIVVNDGSTDSTDQVMSQYTDRPLVRYVRQDNRGQAHAKNEGLRHATGDLVAFLDADDMWMPRKLERQVALFANPAVGVVYSGVGLVDQRGEPVPFEGMRGFLAPRRGRVTRWLVFDNFVPFSSAVIRRDVIETIGGFDERLRMGIDWDLWLRASRLTEFAYVDEPLLLYRVGHAGQMSRNWEERFKSADQIFERFRQSDPSVVPERLLRRVRAYRNVSRAGLYRDVDLAASTRMYLDALGFNRFAVAVLRGLLFNLAAGIRRRTVRPAVPRG